jgi:hypothetical protein
MKCGTLNINTITQMEKDLVQNGVDPHISGFPKGTVGGGNLASHPPEPIIQVLWH